MTIVSVCALLVQTASPWTAGPDLPAPVTNNAVAATGTAVFSFLGLDASKRWDGVHNRAYRWDRAERSWREIDPVPGPGRLAGTAQTVGGKIYLFGGYTVAADGSERSVPNVDVYDPARSTWTAAAPMPVPVDDAVSGVWRDSLIYLISGWHDRDNVRDVQIFDPASDRWQAATPIPGTPVFGHTGGIAGNVIVYVDGTRRTSGRPRYEIVGESWRGDIDPNDPTRITWTQLPAHPGSAKYRAAAVAVDPWIVFAGGTDNPYNYSGLGYDGVPSVPGDEVFGYHVERGTWRRLAPLGTPSMDHRGIARSDGALVIVGGMGAGQTPLRATWVAPVQTVVPARP